LSRTVRLNSFLRWKDARWLWSFHLRKRS